MGNLLVTPITDKETHRGEIIIQSSPTDTTENSATNENQPIPYAVSSMQGWRVHMEDAHICQPVLYAEERRETRNHDGQGVAGGQTKKAKMNGTDNTSSANATATANPTATVSTTTTDSSVNAISTSTTSSSSAAAASGATTSTHTSATATATANTNQFRKIELPNHSLFAVFDGHGGSFAAQYSGLNFVRVLSRQPSFVQYAHFVHEQRTRDLMESNNSSSNNNSDSNNNNDDFSTTPVQQAELDREGRELIERAFKDAFLDLDREIWRIVNQYKNEDCILPRRNNNNNNNNDDEQQNCDNEKNNGDSNQNCIKEEEEYPHSREDSGTTAVAVMLTPQYIICANAGDSRSVYSKQGNCAIPLSYDHKPDDEEEERRIVEAGGFVRVGRVDGDLAVSRGLGDFRFKEYQLYQSMGTTVVADMPHLTAPNGSRRDGGGFGQHPTDIPHPEDQKVNPIPDVIIQKRDHELDEFIVIACDGIFDVQSNQECISLTANIFEDGEHDLGLLCEEVCIHFDFIIIGYFA
jgi:serine/threonine protein phosphatase PrpC